jgi:serine protease Do
MRAYHSVLLALVVALSPPTAVLASTTPDEGSTARIAMARDKVLPVVVSILVVGQEFRQGEPALSLSSGSGTVISAQGHVATNAHVTQHGRSFRVIFADGRELPAKLVGTDTLTDLAVLQVQPPKPETFAFAEFAEKLDLHAGDTVLAMGAPWGLSNSMSAGVVNNPRRLLVSLFDDESDYEDSLGDDEPTGRYYAWIQHDASIAPGNSGGPLVDLNGRIVGVNTRGMIVGGDLAFAIPAPDAAVVVRELIRNGWVARVSLGFRLRSLKDTGFDHGVMVSAIERGSEPEKAGLRVGDRILAINGEVVDAALPVDVPGLQERIAELPVDSSVALRVDRDGKALAIRLRAKALPRERDRDLEVRAFGMSGQRLNSDTARRRNLTAAAGVLVSGVRPGGPAATARPELSPGDVITQVAGISVATPADLIAALKAQPESVVLSVETGGEQQLSVLRPEYGDQDHNPVPELPKPWAGVAVQPFTGSLAHDAGLPSYGFRISRIYPGSPLAAAGARVGDLLTALNGEPLKPANDVSASGFDQRVRDLDLDSEARFDAIRAGKPLQFKVRLSSAPVDASGLATLAETRLRAQLRELGFYDRVAAKLPEGIQGVFVEGVESGGAAGLAHLHRGDVVTSLDGKAVTSPKELSVALAAVLAKDSNRPIPLQVIRGYQTRILYLERYWLLADSKDSR